MVLRSSGLSEVRGSSAGWRNCTVGVWSAGGLGRKNVANGRFNVFATARSSDTDGFDLRRSHASTSASTRSESSLTLTPDSEIAQRSTSGSMVTDAIARS